MNADHIKINPCTEFVHRQLIAHIRTTHMAPTGGKLCAECSLSFATVAELGHHLETKHGRNVDNELSLAMARLNGNACYVLNCTYQNPHADALQRHLNQRHDIGQPTITCPTCYRAYFSARYIKQSVNSFFIFLSVNFKANVVAL